MSGSACASRLRERVALWIAPSLYVPHREERDEAFKDLAEIAYLSRDAVWTSPRVLVRTALEETRRRALAQRASGHRPSRELRRSW